MKNRKRAGPNAGDIKEAKVYRGKIHLLELSIEISDLTREIKGRSTYVLPIYPLLVPNFEVPCKRCFEERFMFCVIQVNTFVRVAFPVGCDLDYRFDFRAACNECTSDNRVVRRASHANRAEQILARRLEAVEEAAYLIRGHECLCQFLVVLEVHTPKRVSVLVIAAAHTINNS